MDVYMHRRQESRSQSTVNRSTEVLAKEHCTSVIVGYGVKMKIRLRASAPLHTQDTEIGLGALV